VADSGASVLISGETGVGKELLARRIHQMSSRAQGPFIVVDISTIPEGLVESELFGHEKGAFTGADRRKPGRIELAHRGTLFIDEVGEIPLFIQTKLLRVLQEKSLVRIGATHTVDSNFRLLAATNRDLETEVARGQFREDLYYRLNVVPLKIPPLRDREGDIILLAEHFLKHYTQKHHRPDLKLSASDIARLNAYHWPGNVRELQNVIERAVLMANDEQLELTLSLEIKPTPEHPFSDIPTMEELQRRYIKYLLEKTGRKIGGSDGAAELLGMKRSTLYNRMRKLGLF
jgi:transcriptional regulator with GAF, ATPase, and Fis domain